MSTARHHACVWIEDPVLGELLAEAARLDRSVSWVVARAWELARTEIARLPKMEEAAPRRRRGRIVTKRNGSPEPVAAEEGDR
jgi:uncharacterized small protein (TIGR04563 family)